MTDPSWREFLADQPALGRSERYPSFFCLEEGNVLLSNTKVGGYYQIEDLEVWIPPQHEVMVKTILLELANTSIPGHGTALGYSRGCVGPLCRRYHREITSEQAHLRAERLNTLRARKSAEEGHILRRRSRRIHVSDYERLKIGAPAYAAVDALLVLFCIDQYRKNPPSRPGGRVKTWQEICSDRAKIAQFMNEKYGNDVFFQ